jgi:hypothetical protein
MRKYQEGIYDAIMNRNNWFNNNTGIMTANGITTIVYYQTTIGIINHRNKTAEFTCGSYDTLTTRMRIYAAEKACNRLGYKFEPINPKRYVNG